MIECLVTLTDWSSFSFTIVLWWVERGAEISYPRSQLCCVPWFGWECIVELTNPIDMGVLSDRNVNLLLFRCDWHVCVAEWTVFDELGIEPLEASICVPKWILLRRSFRKFVLKINQPRYNNIRFKYCSSGSTYVIRIDRKEYPYCHCIYGKYWKVTDPDSLGSKRYSAVFLWKKWRLKTVKEME